MSGATRIVSRRHGAALRVLAAGCACALSISCKQPPRAADPLVGVWRLNPSRTHYSPSADHRRAETMACEPAADGVRCTVTSVRSDGQQLVGQFQAPYGGPAARVTGIPGMDGVTLRRAGDNAVDATFTEHGRPVFGYRATRSMNGDTLTIVSVDAVTRKPLHSVVVYDRVRRAALSRAIEMRGTIHHQNCPQ